MQFGSEIINERATNITKGQPRMYAWRMVELFNCILDCLGQESLEKLILGDDDGETITRIILFDGLDSLDTVAFILNKHLPGEKVFSTKIIDHALKLDKLKSLVPRKRYSGGFMSISLLLLNHGSNEQLRQFVDLILTPYPDKGNIWIDFLLLYKRGSWRGNHLDEMRRHQWKMQPKMGLFGTKEDDAHKEFWIAVSFLECVWMKLGDIDIVQRLGLELDALERRLVEGRED